MNVNSIATQPINALYSKNTGTKPEYIGEHAFMIRELVANSPDVNLTTKGSSPVDETLDVRRATFEEMTELSRALYERGEITLKDHMLLTFDYERATNSLKQNAPGSISADFDMYETPADRNGKRDWIAEFQARALKDLKFGNLIGHQNKMRILTILQQFNAR